MVINYLFFDEYPTLRAWMCVTVWNGQMAREKSELVARSDKMTSERDRLIKERTSAEKQLREAELKLKEMIDKVPSTAVDSVHFTSAVSFPFYQNSPTPFPGRRS